MWTTGNEVCVQRVDLDGPWDQAFLFIVPMELRSKSNFRRGGDSKRESWTGFQSFEATLRMLIRPQLPSGWELGAAAPKKLTLRPAVVSFIFARSTLDAANFSKSVLDACQGVAFHNDASVRAPAAFGVHESGGDHFLAAFARLPGTASPAALIRAQAQLALDCIPHVQDLLGIDD